MRKISQSNKQLGGHEEEDEEQEDDGRGKKVINKNGHLKKVFINHLSEYHRTSLNRFYYSVN